MVGDKEHANLKSKVWGFTVVDQAYRLVCQRIGLVKPLVRE